MAESKILFDNGVHKCVMFSIDDEEQEESYLSVNQYLLVQNGSGILIDPGSEAIFHELCDEVSQYIPIENIKFVFFSHQDPDVAGSISKWSVSTSTKLVMPSIWTRFMTHYGVLDTDRVFSIPDKGTQIPFGQGYIKFVPAHFLHSPGNFSLYDSQSKILFSGDIGAAVVPPMAVYKDVENFDSHKPYLESFHKRYMASNKFCKAWVTSVSQLDVTMIAPQHGAVFEDENVKKFLSWFNTLECGSDLIDDLY